MMPIKEPIYRLIGKRIADARDAKGLSQLELVKLLRGRGIEIQRTSITHMEKGVQRIMIHLLYPIADALGVSVSSLLPDQVEAKATETSIPPNAPGSEWVKKVVSETVEKKKRRRNAS